MFHMILYFACSHMIEMVNKRSWFQFLLSLLLFFWLSWLFIYSFIYTSFFNFDHFHACLRIFLNKLLQKCNLITKAHQPCVSHRNLLTSACVKSFASDLWPKIRPWAIMAFSVCDVLPLKWVPASVDVIL